MRTKSLILVLLLILVSVSGCATSGNSTRKGNRIESVDDELMNSDESLTTRVNAANIDYFVNEVLKNLTSDEVMPILKKDAKGERVILKIGKIRNRTSFDVQVMLVKDKLLRNFIMSGKFIVKSPGMGALSMNSSENKVKEGLLLTGTIKEGKKGAKNNASFVEYIFEYKLLNSKGDVVYKNKVQFKNSAKSR